MHVWSGLRDVPPGFGPSVVTLGNFDGVHRGHRAVLARVIELAASRAAPSVAVTFDPHPLAVLHPQRAPQLITSLDQRLSLLDATAVDAVLVLEFTDAFAQQTPEEFVTSVFVDSLSAGAVVVGEDTRFGVNNSGDVSTLRRLGSEHGFDVVVLPGVGDGPRWSSSMVRARLAEGDVEGATIVLGHPHQVAGTVVHGDHRGRGLGFPTANLGEDVEGLVPADGVYAGWLTRAGRAAGEADRSFPAAISIGTNPTFDGTRRRVEAYVLDRDDLDLYGERVVYDFVQRLRPTLKFDSVEALVEQMNADCDRCRTVLKSIVPS